VRQEEQAQEALTALRRRHLRRTASLVVLVFALVLGGGGPKAGAAGPPGLGGLWASGVLAGSARLHAEIDPDGLATTYHFDYIAEAAYAANLSAGREGFVGAAKVPGTEAAIGSGTSSVPVVQLLSSLAPETRYRYRIVAKNTAGSAASPAETFVTQGLGGGALLADSRGWEMVSPIDKNGGEVEAPGALAGGGVLQAAATGGAVTYGSAASFGGDAQGAPLASQYLSRRGADAWATENVTAPLLSASFATESEQGVPYRIFSPDLARGLLSSGDHCRGQVEGCPVANPPPAGSDAPAGEAND
jgi:hypothetical protein